MCCPAWATPVIGTLAATPARAEIEDLMHPVHLAVDRSDGRARRSRLDVIQPHFVVEGLRTENSGDKVKCSWA